MKNYFTCLNKAILRRFLSAMCLTALVVTATPRNGFAIKNANDYETQQSKKISGVINDESGYTIPGVNVSIKGTTQGTTSDIDGKFEIEAQEGAILIFSFIGYKTQEIVVSNKTSINVIMVEDKQLLEDVVVVGYGIQKKSNLTGAVSSVKSEEISKIAVSTPAESLQGRISGVSVKSLGGAPGSGVEVKIRGIGSFGGNTPLYIIDGIPGDINFVNPEDISSIEVLKDASSAAIYGSKAGNGVILITTKNGKKGDVKINFSSYYGIQNVVNTLDLSNAEEWLKINRMVHENAGSNLQKSAKWLTPEWTYKNANTDWQDAIYRQSATQNYSLNLSGGTDNVKYLLSGSYLNQEGTIIGTGYVKYNLRAKGELKKGNLTVSPNFSIQSNKIDLQTLSLTETRKMTPIIPVYDKSNVSGYGYLEGLAYDNPVGKQNLNDSNERNFEINTSINANYKIFEGLNISMNTAITDYFYNYKSHHPSYKINSKTTVPYAAVSENNSRKTTYLFEPIINFTKDINKHNIGLMLGSTLLKSNYRSAGATVEGKDADGNKAGFIDENFNTINAGVGGLTTGNGTEVNYTRQSIFGRFNYSYDGKYLVQATLRRDGSSRFGADSRFGTFPSFSAGWNINKEGFFANFTEIVNTLKIRASYGKLGSENNLTDYEYSARVYSGNGYPLGKSQNLVGSNGVNVLNNTNLKWEEVTAQNFGIDFGLLNSKITGSINYYINKRTDMLLNSPVALSSGISNPKINIGEMENKGLELELTYQKKEGELNWDITGTLTTVKNTVLKLSDTGTSIWGSSAGSESATKTVVGKSISSFYLYQMDGIFQSQEEINNHYTIVNGKKILLQKDAKPGDVRYRDMNKDGKINGDDKTYSGSSIPDFEYSLNINLYYKNFDFTAFFNGVHGNYIYNMTKYYTESMNNNDNYSKNALNAWTPENLSNTMPRALFGDIDNSKTSTRFLENGSFLRLKNLQIGYTLDKNLSKILNVEKLRIYASAQNLLTFTEYSGYDPEVGSTNEWDKGIDWGGYPISKTYLFGIQLTF